MEKIFLKHRTVLFIGLLFVVGGTQTLVALFSPLSLETYIVRPSIVLVVGLITLSNCFSPKLTSQRKTFYQFVGILSTTAWLLFLLTDSNIIMLTMTEMWPIIVILSGIILIIVSFLHYRYIPISIILSALVLIVLGSMFSLFSFNIITLSFTDFASKWWPVLFILFGLGLIILFFYMQYHEKEKWIIDADDDEDIA